MKYAGIDVSKKTLHLAILEPAWEGEFLNTAAGHRKIARKLGRGRFRVVIEATGTYSQEIARALAETASVEVMVANPRTTKAFAGALDQRGKTDGMDCVMLARFASAMPFRPWKPPSEASYILKRLMRRRAQLSRQQTAEKVRLKEERCVVQADPFVAEDIEVNLQHLAGRIERIEKRALEHVRAHGELEQWLTQLVTIPGVANVTGLALMAERGELIDELGARQLTAYSGLDPQPWQSGGMDARRRISKRGNKYLRTTLYMASWNVARHAPEVGAWRQKLIDRGKAPKVANIAVARRLLHAVVGMEETGTDWDGSKFYSGGTCA